MRVAGGKIKGHNLKVPKARDIRPTQESIRLSIFNILAGMVDNRKTMDLYAGSGALGIEALSRGAREVFFIESNRHACEVIRENLKHPQIEHKGKVICRDVNRALMDFPQRDIDLVFLDPPYALGSLRNVFESLVPLLKRGAIIVYEHAKTTE